MKLFTFTALTLTFVFLFGSDSVSAQGRSGGNNGGGRPAGTGQPTGTGRPDTSPGVDRGMGRASDRSGGRADDGWANASTRSNGRYDSGIDRARNAREKAADLNDTELNRYRGLSKKLGTTPEEMRSRYEAAVLANPDLKYGHFVSAHVVSDNLSARYPNITADAILAGYINGDSLGRTLRNLGMTKEEAKAAEKNAEIAMLNAKRRVQ